MTATETSDKPEITLSLVTELIAEQFPQWAHLPITTIKKGWDNKTFRLGEDMLIRLPTAKEYAPQVEKEQKWLPILAPYLSFSIPEPLAQGQPSINYPWHWSVYRWIEGESANSSSINDLNLFATELAQFLNELHKIDSTDGPLPGVSNFYRGDSPLVYDAETQLAISQLKDFIDVNTTTSIWENAISTKWNKKPVWIHGDFSAENILVKGGRLTAIIDFGCMAVGDPACDLTIAWTFLTKESRKIFKSQLSLDSGTWARARGWALWKALITMTALKDKTGAEDQKIQQVINEILTE